MCDKKCKNIECDNLVLKKRVYCSLKCRNVYVNKYLRDYSKNAEALCKKDLYNKEPKCCKECGNKIVYEKRFNNYCNSSCQAKSTNLGRKLSGNSRKKISKSNTKDISELKYIFCKSCNNKILVKNRKKFCSDKCRKNFRRKEMNEFQKYKLDCLFSFNLSDYEEEFNFKLIEEHGWYKPVNRGNNLNGVSRDHIYSIRDGFDNSIEPKLIAHPANCKLILQRQNSSKHKRSDIKLEDLKEKINKWNKKYKD